MGGAADDLLNVVTWSDVIDPQRALHMGRMAHGNDTDIELTRRRMLGWLAGAGAGALAAIGCRSSSGSSGNGAASDGGAGTDGVSGDDAGALDAANDANGEGAAGDGGACTSTPEGEVGPYFADDSDPRFNRSNILSNLDGSNVQSGVPLTLTIFVLDAKNGCKPYANAQVDIWHCNASGVYSDQAAESTTTEQWLRGYQLTDASGKVTFTTIMPGWYQGRTTHIHLRIRSTYDDAAGLNDGTNTTQLFFAQTLDDSLATTVAPYDSEGKNPTTNASDHVYAQEENGANQLVVSGDATSGYVAAVTLFLPIVSNGTSTGTPGGDGGGPGGGPGGGGPPGGDGGPPGPPPDGGSPADGG